MNFKVLGIFLVIIAGVIGAVVFTGDDGKSSDIAPQTKKIEDSTTDTQEKKSERISGPVETTDSQERKPERISEPVAENPAPRKTSTSSLVEVREITEAMTGTTHETRGIVTTLREGKDNVFFTLRDANGNETIKGVLFAKTNRDDPSRKEMLLQSRDNNSVVYLKGEIDIYKGELEIKTWQVYTK